MEPPKYPPWYDFTCICKQHNFLDTSKHRTGIHVSPRHMMQIPTHSRSWQNDSLEEMVRWSRHLNSKNTWVTFPPQKNGTWLLFLETWTFFRLCTSMQWTTISAIDDHSFGGQICGSIKNQVYTSCIQLLPEWKLFWGRTPNPKPPSVTRFFFGFSVGKTCREEVNRITKPPKNIWVGEKCLGT